MEAQMSEKTAAQKAAEAKDAEAAKKAAAEKEAAEAREAEKKAEADRAEAEKADAEQVAKANADATKKAEDDAAAAKAAETPSPEVSAKADPAGTADSATSREARAGNALDAEGRSRPLTDLEAQQEAALASRRSANDGSVSPKSQTILNPDVEMRADATNDALTAKREQLAAEAVNGDSPAAEDLLTAYDKVAEAQKTLDEAMRVRDAARDDYDHLLDRQARSVTEESPFAAYVEAQNRKRELDIPDRYRNQKGS